MELPTPEDVDSILSSPFVVTFWPMIVGALLAFVSMVKGSNTTTFLIVVAAAAVQAFHMGVLRPAE